MVPLKSLWESLCILGTMEVSVSVRVSVSSRFPRLIGSVFFPLAHASFLVLETFYCTYMYAHSTGSRTRC